MYNLVTGRILRCEVFVDRIDSLSVHTTTKSVYREEHEMLEILAFDAEGNTFSTLRGVEFVWSVSNEEGSGKARDILQIVPFRGSQQEVDPVIAQMEHQVLL